MSTANFYDTRGLDRAAHHRRDPHWLSARLAHADSRFVPLWRGANLIVSADSEAPRAVLLQRGGIAGEGQTIFLGLAGDRAYFAIDLSVLDDPLAGLTGAGGAAFVDLRRVGPLLPRAESALLAYARGMVHWHQRHAFCAQCGAPTLPAEVGHLRRCDACGAVHFPRTDPAVIMLVHDGNRCLLGRQASWATGMHSTLAGFVEPGESLEEAVRREVAEETGIAVADIRYHSAQPWPFPSSLMLGFTARALSTAIELDTRELEAARWFERDFLRRHQDDDEFRLPRADSIARRLIEEWLRG